MSKTEGKNTGYSQEQASSVGVEECKNHSSVINIVRRVLKVRFMTTCHQLVGGGGMGRGAEAESDSESDSFINVHGLYILIINLGRITKKFINVDVNTYTFTKIQNQWKAN